MAIIESDILIDSMQDGRTVVAAHARVAARTEPLYAQRAAGTNKNASNLALSDWFHPPVIHEVMQLPGRIRVDTTDNVYVAKVIVTVQDEQGGILEQEEAKLIYNAWWEFPTTAQGT